MKKSFLISILSLTTLIAGCGCGSKPSTETTTNIATETIIETETNTEADVVIESLPWRALGSLETHPELRQAFDNLFQVTGEAGSKVGQIYYNTDTEQADQNVTLFMVLKNTSTRGYFMSDETRDAIGKIAFDNYTDVDDASAIYATINAYFGLLPDQTEGEFDGGEYISRAQAMSILMRAVTQVTDDEKPAENKDFTSVVGDSKYTDFAAPMDAYAYMHTGVSGDVGEAALDEKTFTTSMTKGEYIYMVTNYLVEDYQATLKEKGYVDSYADVAVSLSTIKDGGDITIKEAMADPSQGVPTDMYKVFETAVKYGFITEDELQNWDSVISKQDAIDIFTSMALNYTHEFGNALFGGEYQTPEQEAAKDAAQKEYSETAEFGLTLPGEGTGMAKFQAWARSQGADAAYGWTFVYENGKGAGDQPTYGVYMNENSPLYGTVYHVGDILPDGSRLDGTREEEDAISAEKAKENVEEAGGKVYIDEETGKEVWEIP